ncbi:hypothetical protein ABZ897_45105 [Nonomuraea sp. NPDC046802]|uniref:hypothetical protein n=1 Tax=Nonomuraea sp. NPDC046802 TaxID=3154919 RepID=UPI0033F80E4A
MRGRTAAVIGSIIASATLTLAVPGAAHGATGTFTYTDARNVQRSLNNPLDNRCYNIGRAYDPVTNNTDRTAELYANRGCSGDVQVIAPNGSADDAAFQSVMFTDD